ncbi:MAG: DegV family protein [Chloroflexota bacterium]|nr:DegV family protein [Chloroflexota bacterium]
MRELYPVAVVTDSAAGLPEELVGQYRIGVVPLVVQLGGRIYDSEELGIDAFYQLLRDPASLPATTSAPSIGNFLAMYERVARWAKAVVSVHVAGEQSGTCNVARLAGEHSSIPVQVIDTGTTAMAEGFVALEAARAALEACSLSEVVARTRAVVPRVELFALLESVDYAVRGGRLASAARLVNSILKIQPVVSVKDNRLALLTQCRRRATGLRRLVEKLQARVGERPLHLAVHYAEDELEGEGQQLLATLRARFNCVESFLTRVPMALGVHAGPGSLGIGYYAEGHAASPTTWRERIGVLLG